MSPRRHRRHPARPRSTPSPKNPRTRRQISPSPFATCGSRSPIRFLVGRRRDGLVFDRGRGGLFPQYLGRTRLCVAVDGVWSEGDRQRRHKKGGSVIPSAHKHSRACLCRQDSTPSPKNSPARRQASPSPIAACGSRSTVRFLGGRRGDGVVFAVARCSTADVRGCVWRWHGGRSLMNLIPGRIGQANEPIAPRRRGLRITDDRPLGGRRRDGWFFGRGFGGWFAQYRGRRRLWSGEEPPTGGLRHPISAQAFTCLLMSSGFISIESRCCGEHPAPRSPPQAGRGSPIQTLGRTTHAVAPATQSSSAQLDA